MIFETKFCSVFLRRSAVMAGFAGLVLPLGAAESGWWNKEWSHRQKITIDTGTDAAAVSGDIGGATALIRLHDGNFQFGLAGEGASDLRFIAEDGKTILSHQVEKFDALLNEAYVWVKFPTVSPGKKSEIYLYYGNSTAPAAQPNDTYDANTKFAYHFSDQSGNPRDATSNANHAETPAVPSEGSLIGGGIRLLGTAPVIIPSSLPNAWKANQAFTWSAWIKPDALQPGAVLLSRGNEIDGLRVLIDQGLPVVEILSAAGPVKSSTAAPVAVGTWSHLAVVADGGVLRVLVNGEAYGEVKAAVPALDGPINLGGLPVGAGTTGTIPFLGEVDEMQLSDIARPTGWIKFAAVNQGNSDAAARSLFLGESESGEGGGGHSAAFEHVMLFGDIAKNMMFDGWIAIGVCVLMIIAGWSVAVKKFSYLNSIQKGGDEFMRQWKNLSSDLTALDHADESNVKSMGGNVNSNERSLVEKSPLYHIYQIGSEEIRHRLERDKTRTQGLSGRSIQAIRASLDAGLVKENHKMTKGLVFLTMSIAGGPYVGLLGTVVGVMITFAIIAKSGEVDVNSIAPGIASALLATVAGLVVAIPALFIYSYLNTRIKETLSLMHVFIDEFVAKMAEFYPPAGEASPYAPVADPSVKPI